MKDCKKIHPLLALYADEQLSPSEKSKVEKHLGLCADARKELEQFGGLLKTLRQMPGPEVPSDLHGKIMAKLGRSATPLPKHHGFWGAPAWALSAAAVLLLVLLNQNPHWNDISRVNKPVLEPDSALGPNSGTAPSAENGFENKASSNSLRPASGSIRSASSPHPQLDVLPQAQSPAANANADLKLPDQFENEKSKDISKKVEATRAGLPSNEPAPKEEALGAAAAKPGGLLMDSRAVRAKKRMAAAPSAPLEAQAFAPAETMPLPTPTAESLDKSEKSVPYSREDVITTWKGNNGPSTVESQALVTDAETFQKYWGVPHPGEAPPRVDFTQQAVVVLMAGGKPTAGYSIYVSRLEEKTDQLVIHYRLDSPAADAVTAQILTNPWSLQVIPKPSKPVLFLKDP